MRIEILDDEGNVINIIIATEEFAETYYPGHWRLWVPPVPDPE